MQGSDDGMPTEIFWEAKERMETEGEILRDCLDGPLRSKMTMHLLLMHRHGLVVDADLEAFGADHRDHILEMYRTVG